MSVITETLIPASLTNGQPVSLTGSTGTLSSGAAGMACDVYDSPERKMGLQKLSAKEAVEYIFEGAAGDDFYSISRMVPSTDPDRAKDKEEDWENVFPVLHSDTHRHPELIEALGDVKTFITLASYKSESRFLPAPGKFSYSAKKKDVRRLHGVALDLDGGRSPEDRKAHLPGAMLTQEELLSGFADLVRTGVVPPPQIWARGTRGCYAIYLFDQPMERIEEAKQLWRNIRECYMLPRAYHLAADELFRSIIQPLKAPGACGGVVTYYKVTGSFGMPIPKTNLLRMADELRALPQECDVPQASDSKDVYLSRIRTVSTTVKKHRNVDRMNRVWWCLLRFVEMREVTNHFRGEPGYPRRLYFRDLASALKSYFFVLNRGNAQDAYIKTLEECQNHNAELARPLDDDKLQTLVYEAKPALANGNPGERFFRKRIHIVHDMGITGEISKLLKLTHLESDRRRNERRREDKEAKAKLAFERKQARDDRKRVEADEKRERQESRNATRLIAQRAQAGLQRRSKERSQRESLIRDLVLQGVSTKIIESETGAYRQQISRVKTTMQDEGIIIPEAVKLKRGRKALSNT